MKKNFKVGDRVILNHFGVIGTIETRLTEGYFHVVVTDGEYSSCRLTLHEDDLTSFPDDNTQKKG